MSAVEQGVVADLRMESVDMRTTTKRLYEEAERLEQEASVKRTRAAVLETHAVEWDVAANIIEERNLRVTRDGAGHVVVSVDPAK